MISTQLPIVESKARPREIAAHCNGNLPISIQFVYSFQIIVPVVQRTEQGFPKAKPPFYQPLANVLSNAQTAVSKRLE
jgi:hypothetical protein